MKYTDLLITNQDLTPLPVLLGGVVVELHLQAGRLLHKYQGTVPIILCKILGVSGPAGQLLRQKGIDPPKRRASRLCGCGDVLCAEVWLIIESKQFLTLSVFDYNVFSPKGSHVISDNFC